MYTSIQVPYNYAGMVGWCQYIIKNTVGLCAMVYMYIITIIIDLFIALLEIVIGITTQ